MKEKEPCEGKTAEEGDGCCFDCVARLWNLSKAAADENLKCLYIEHAVPGGYMSCLRSMLNQALRARTVVLAAFH